MALLTGLAEGRSPLGSPPVQRGAAPAHPPSAGNNWVLFGGTDGDSKRNGVGVSLSPCLSLEHCGMHFLAATPFASGPISVGQCRRGAAGASC